MKWMEPIFMDGSRFKGVSLRLEIVTKVPIMEVVKYVVILSWSDEKIGWMFSGQAMWKGS